jgi:branched-chain amino acid transport system permease protein
MERFLDTGNLGIGVTLAAMVGLVIGGTTRAWGAVIGVAITVAVFDIIIQSYIPLPQAWYGQAIPVIRQMVFGLALILVLMFRPHGILGQMRRDKLMRRTHRG